MADSPRIFKAEEKKETQIKLLENLIELGAFLAKDNKDILEPIPPAPLGVGGVNVLPIPPQKRNRFVLFVRDSMLSQIAPEVKFDSSIEDNLKRVIQAFTPEEQLEVAEKVKNVLQQFIRIHINDTPRDVDVRDYINNTPILSYFLNYEMMANPAPKP